MTFLDHLEQLRWHLIRAVGSIFLFAIIAFANKEFIWTSVIMAPSRSNFWTYRMMCRISDQLCIKKLDFKLISIEMASQFTMALTTSLLIGVMFAFPYAFWEIWRFIKPGLYPRERKASSGAVFFVTFLFLLGVFFGYYIVSPLAINFLANFKLDEAIENQFTVSSYLSTLAMLTLACGITFQLPVVAFFLSKAGIVTPAFMREYRRHAFVVILVLAAVITPSPDIYSQLLVSFPLFLLYEVSIWVSAAVARQRMKELESEG
ncbi:MAG: twin-arginine translocase subunit TatC [Ferruginibacter sp.]|nr:twin-arginine translocase subunit TatC [Cytophagales bacterium]